MKTNQLLAGIMVMQGLILASVWSGRPAMESVAEAQVPDPGAQRIAMINELKSLNAKVDSLTTFLESGRLQVHIPKADER